MSVKEFLINRFKNKNKTNHLENKFNISDYIYFDGIEGNSGLTGIYQISFTVKEKHQLLIVIIVNSMLLLNEGIFYHHSGIRRIQESELRKTNLCEKNLGEYETYAVIALDNKNECYNGEGIRLATNAEITKLKLTKIFQNKK